MWRSLPTLVLVVLAVLAGTAGPSRAEPLPPGEEPVVMVERPDVKGPPTAGVLLGEEGLVVVPSTVVGRHKRLNVFLAAQDKRTGNVVSVDEDAGLALLDVGRVPGQRTIPFYAGRPMEKGAVLVVRGLEGGLPWQQASANVMATQTGPWGNLAAGFLTLDGQNDGTGADAGAAVMAPDGTLAGVHLGRMRVEGAPPARFVVSGVDRLRAFLRVATAGLPVARVCINSTAPGSVVFINGKDRGPAPARVSGFVAGWHTVRVTAPGFAPVERVVLAGLEEGLCHDVELARSPSVAFRSAVQGITARVDGNPPVALATGMPLYLPEGAHSVSITAPGYRAFTWEGTLAAADSPVVDVTLVKQHGTMSVRALPEGAHVWVEGRDAGPTPLVDLKLAPGRWRVELRAPHHRPLALGAVTIVDGAATDLGEQVLQPLPARLTLAPGVAEDGDEVYLNGQRVAGSSWKVQPGYHELVVRRSWHNPGKLRVFVEPEEVKTVAPRPEQVPEARTRKAKLAGGVGAVVASVGGAAAGVALVGMAALAAVGTAWAYRGYLDATEEAQWDLRYGMANVFMWLGAGALVSSVVVVVCAVLAASGAGWALMTLPEDPSRVPETPRPARPADAAAKGGA